MEITAAVLRDVGAALSVETLQLDPPGPGEVLVDMKASGVCHSDWHVVTGDSKVDLPVVLGHEGSGLVAEVGPGVDHLAVGDHVALSWIPYCGECRVCAAGRTHLCATFQRPLWAGTMLDGTRRLRDAEGREVSHLSAISTWSTHSVVPAISCVPMPDIPFEISALIGCGVTTGVGAALNKADVRPGSTTVIIGAGGVGLSIAMGAAYAGASTIVVADANPAKQQMALDMGATHFFVGDPAGLVDELTDGFGADTAFDAVGLTSIQSRLIDLLAPGGIAVLVGLPAQGATFDVDPQVVIRGERIITGSIFGSAATHRDFARYADLYLDGQLPLDRLVTQRYRLDQVNDACASMLSGTQGRGVLMLDD